MYSKKEGDQMSVELNDVKNACLDNGAIMAPI